MALLFCDAAERCQVEGLGKPVAWLDGLVCCDTCRLFLWRKQAPQIAKESPSKKVAVQIDEFGSVGGLAMVGGQLHLVLKVQGGEVQLRRWDGERKWHLAVEMMPLKEGTRAKSQSILEIKGELVDIQDKVGSCLASCSNFKDAIRPDSWACMGQHRKHGRNWRVPSSLRAGP